MRWLLNWKNRSRLIFPLHDRGKIQEHLNSAYALSLAKIDEESLRWISNTDVRSLVASLIEYWKAVRERRDVESYMAMTGADDRVRDSIDQLNTKTGRFYRPFADGSKRWADAITIPRQGGIQVHRGGLFPTGGTDHCRAFE